MLTTVSTAMSWWNPPSLGFTPKNSASRLAEVMEPS
jgi:hypothetical protein